MDQYVTKGPTAPPDLVGEIDEALWEKIDAAVGGVVHLDTAVLIEGGAPRPHIVVVVVERRRLPSDQELRRHFGLTRREIQVAHFLADRLSDEEVADRLGIKPNTARCHSQRVLTKLGVHSRNEVRSILLGPEESRTPSLARQVA